MPILNKIPVVKGMHVNGSTSSPTGERENTKHAPPFPFPFSPLLLKV